MIVVTGATGHIGGRIAEVLLSEGYRVRAVARAPERLENLVKKGVEAAVGQIQDTPFLTEALRGARAAFVMIPPNYASPDFLAYQDEVGESIARAIEGSGVGYVLNLSSQGADIDGPTGPIRGLREQERRLEGLAGVDVLHLRPAYFMENLLLNIETIKKYSTAGSAIRGDLKMPMIATKDIAEFAAGRLMRLDFAGKSASDLLGQRDLSLEEATKVIGARLNRPDLRYVRLSYEEASRNMVKAGLSQDVARLMVEMSRAYNEGLLGKETPRTAESTTRTSIEEFAETFARLYALQGSE